MNNFLAADALASLAACPNPPASPAPEENAAQVAAMTD